MDLKDSNLAIKLSREYFLLKGHDGAIVSANFSPDGLLIVSSSYDGTIKIWDVMAEKCIRTVAYKNKEYFISCSFSPDGLFIVSCCSDKIKIWCAATGNCIKTLVGHYCTINSCSYSPDGSLIISSSVDMSVKIWDAVTGLCIKTLVGHSDRVNFCCFSPDGKFIASCSSDHRIKIWDVITGLCVTTLVDHSGPINSCSFSPDGSQIISCGNNKSIKIWSISGACIRTIYHYTDMFSCKFSSNAEIINVSSFDNQILFYTVTGRFIKSLVGSIINTDYYSPNGDQIVTCSNKNIIIWNFPLGIESECLSSQDKAL